MHYRHWLSLALILCAVAMVGCACLPRIDPTGERVFIWPQNQPVVATPGVGNVQAPPVYTDPVFPQPALPPTAVAGAVPAVPVAVDRMAITPDRVLAPVGSEVILRAGICAKEGFLLTDQKVEWLIARESAGELVDLGGKGYCRDPILPWNKPKKVDNQYGIGYTAKMPLLITRGTANPADDVQIEPGHAWASITSPVEGISNVTAVTPTIVDWTARRATATIYWIDAQWVLPPATISAGGSQVLSTTLLRQTDRTPLEGWIVRYRVDAGAANASAEQPGQVVEVITGADGRASIDVTPTGSDGSATQIDIEVVRPAGLGGTAYPRLVVANGSTRINWTGQSTPYLPELDQPVGEPAFQSPQLGPPPSSQPIGPQPPVTQPSQPTTPRNAGRPQLDVQVYGEAQSQVGSSTRFQVVIRNQGNAEATGIVLTDRYDQGLSHSERADRTMTLKNDQVGSLAPGQSRSLDLTFNVTKSGRLCHEVSVSCTECSGESPAKGTGCVNVPVPQPTGQPNLDVKKDGPRLVREGDVALFKISVRNTGEVPLNNLLVVDEYDRSLSPQPVGAGHEIVNGNIQWRIDRLEVGQSRTFEVNCTCLRAVANACGLVKVTDDSGLMRVDNHCLEIEPRGERAAVVPGAEAATGETLKVLISPTTTQPRAQARTTIFVYVDNKSTRPEKQVQLRIQFPPELTPDVTTMTNNANLRGRFEAGILTFDPVAELRNPERLAFTIPMSANQPGFVNIVAEARSSSTPQPVSHSVRLEILNR